MQHPTEMDLLIFSPSAQDVFFPSAYSNYITCKLGNCFGALFIIQNI